MLFRSGRLARTVRGFTWHSAVAAQAQFGLWSQVSLRVRMQLSVVFSAFLLNIFYNRVSSLYFHIGETEKKCFIEEIPDETMIIGERLLLTAS